MSKNDRHVVPHNNMWAYRAQGSSRVSRIYNTQSDAYAGAKRTVANNGGGEVRIHGTNGRIRNSNTIGGGNDPFPPRDKKY